MRIIRTITLLSGLIPLVANAGSYTVQIGTYRNPDHTVIEDRMPEDIGEIRTATTASGLTEFLVGSFGTFSEAEDALERLQGAGFDDAFVRRQGDSPRGSGGTVTDEESNLPQDDRALLSSLSEEERRSVVYLDGRLHRKIGDQFIPLESALDQSRTR